MTALTSSYTVTTTNLGWRSHLTASVHTTEGQALIHNAAVLEYWRKLWVLPNKGPRWRPFMVQKVAGAGGTSVSGIKANLARARQLGFTTVLQLRDDNGNMRSLEDIKDLFAEYYPGIMRGDCRPHVLCYGNEPGGNNAGVTPTEFAVRASDAHEYIATIDDQLQFTLGGAPASWANTYKYAIAAARAKKKNARRKSKLIIAHHYRGRCSLAREHDMQGFLKSTIPDSYTIMGEGGRAFLGGPDTGEITTTHGGVFAAAHALENMMGNIATCHFTLQNNENISGVSGNGMYSREMVKKPSAICYENYVAWLMKSPILDVTRDNYDHTGVFVNENGRLVAYYCPPSTDEHALDVVTKWIRMSAQANDITHINMTDILTYLAGLGPQPSYSPLWEPDWNAAQDVFDTCAADRNANSKTITVDVSAGGYTQFYWPDNDRDRYIGDFGAPQVNLSSGTLTITLPKNTMMRGQLRVV